MSEVIVEHGLATLIFDAEKSSTTLNETILSIMGEYEFSLYDQSIKEAFEEWMMEDYDRDYVVADERYIFHIESIKFELNSMFDVSESQVIKKSPEEFQFMSIYNTMYSFRDETLIGELLKDMENTES